MLYGGEVTVRLTDSLGRVFSAVRASAQYRATRSSDQYGSPRASIRARNLTSHTLGSHADVGAVVMGPVLHSTPWPSPLAAQRWSTRRSARSSRRPTGVRAASSEAPRPPAPPTGDQARQARFWLVLLGLVAVSVYLSIVIWHQIERTLRFVDTSTTVEPSEPYPPEPPPPVAGERGRDALLALPGGIWAAGERVTAARRVRARPLGVHGLVRRAPAIGPDDRQSSAGTRA